MAEAVPDVRDDTAAKIASTVAAVAAAFVAQRALAAAWRVVTGSHPDEDDNAPLTEVMVFAALSAATIAVARTWASRKARAYMAREH